MKFHSQFSCNEQNQCHYSGSGQFPQLAHHGQTQIEQSCSTKRVAQAVYELGHESRNSLVQGKVGDDAYNNHEYNGVLQDLQDYMSHNQQFSLLVVSLILPLLDLAQCKADGI